MNKSITSQPLLQAGRNHIKSLFYREADEPAQPKEDVSLDKAEELQIYQRLAHEFIDSRLGAEPTNCRVDQLAKILQAIDENNCFCGHDQQH